MQTKLLMANATIKALTKQLKAEREARVIFDSVLAFAEETGRSKYNGSNSFKNEALEFVWLNYLSSMAHEWLATDTGDKYMLVADKEDF